MNNNLCAEPYSYQTLENDSTIRVLILQPAKTYESPLFANIVHVDRQDLFSSMKLAERLISSSRDHNAIWECVSYSWGEISFSHDLWIGQGSNIRITANVDSMLRHLRKEGKTRSLWIDAVCLNQSDAVEKAIQVSLMGEIFRQAQKVHVWIGDGTHIASLQQTFQFFKSIALSKDTKMVEESSGVELVHSVEGIFQLLEQPWFRRRWILQEVSLGHDVTVRCGSLKISWDWLSEGIIAFGGRFLDLCFRESHVNAITQVVSLHQGRAPILELLSRFHLAQCSDPRDKLFALWGMATDIVPESGGALYIEGAGGHNKISIDYSEPWLATYSNFAHACVELGSMPIVLEHAISFGSLAQLNRESPSWVPDWKSQRTWARRVTILPGAENEYSASRVKKIGEQLGLDLQAESYGPVTLVQGSGHQSLLCEMQRTSASGPSADAFHVFISSLYSNRRKQPGDLSFTSTLTAAVLDAYLNYSHSRLSRNAQELKESLFGEIPTAMELSQLGSIYQKTTDRVSSAINYHTRTLSSRLDNQSIGTRSSIESPLLAVSRLLRHRTVFFLTVKTLKIAGIGPPDMGDGDFVFRLPKMYPETAAFVIRPVVGEDNFLPKKPQFRLVGLCFFAESKNLPVECKSKDTVTIV